MPSRCIYVPMANFDTEPKYKVKTNCRQIHALLTYPRRSRSRSKEFLGRDEAMPLWRHNICESCWAKLRVDEHDSRLKQPFRFSRVLKGDICCFYGKRNRDRIYVRHDGREPPLCGSVPALVAIAPACSTVPHARHRPPGSACSEIRTSPSHRSFPPRTGQVACLPGHCRLSLVTIPFALKSTASEGR